MLIRQVKCKCCTSVDQITMTGTGKLSCVLWCKFHDIWLLVHLTININLSVAKLHFLKKIQENAITWCILAIVTIILNISCVIWWTITRSKLLESNAQSVSQMLKEEVNLLLLPRMVLKELFTSCAGNEFWQSSRLVWLYLQSLLFSV